MLKTLKLLDIGNFIIRRHAFPSLDYINYSSKSVVLDELKKDVRVTLINENDNVTIVNLSEAQQLSKAQSLKLVKISDLDVKTRRPLYRLISADDYLKAQYKLRHAKKEAKKEWSIKGEKSISMSTRIGNNDLITNCKKITKWMDRCYSVRIIINGESKLQNAEEMMAKVIKECGANSKMQQKSTKGSTVKFSLVPLPPNPDIPIEQPEDEEIKADNTGKDS